MLGRFVSKMRKVLLLLLYIEILVVVVDTGDMWVMPLKRNHGITCLPSHNVRALLGLLALCG